MNYHPKRPNNEEMTLFYIEFEKWLKDKDAYPVKFKEEKQQKEERTYSSLKNVPWQLRKQGTKVTIKKGLRYLRGENNWIRLCDHDISMAHCRTCQNERKRNKICLHSTHEDFCVPCNPDRNFVQHKPINSVPSIRLEFCCHGNLKEQSQECCKRVKCVATIFKCTRDGIPKYGNYCGYHRRDFHPDPIKPKERKWPSNNIREGTKEGEVVKFILGEYWLANDIDINRQCLTVKARPDIVMKFDSFHVIIEVDENQHKSYCHKKEMTRKTAVINDIDGPVVYIHFNPDSYTFNGTHYPKGILECEIERKTRLEHLKMFIWKWFKDPPTSSSVHYLFFDSL